MEEKKIHYNIFREDDTKESSESLVDELNELQINEYYEEESGDEELPVDEEAVLLAEEMDDDEDEEIEIELSKQQEKEFKNIYDLSLEFAQESTILRMNYEDFITEVFVTALGMTEGIARFETVNLLGRASKGKTVAYRKNIEVVGENYLYSGEDTAINNLVASLNEYVKVKTARSRYSSNEYEVLSLLAFFLLNHGWELVFRLTLPTKITQKLNKVKEEYNRMLFALYKSFDAFLKKVNPSLIKYDLITKQNNQVMEILRDNNITLNVDEANQLKAFREQYVGIIGGTRINQEVILKHLGIGETTYRKYLPGELQYLQYILKEEQYNLLTTLILA